MGIKGIWCLDLETENMIALYADAVLITNRRLWTTMEKTTNPKVASGDGLAMAVRAGASSKDMAFFQFHPTAVIDSK